ILKKESLPLDHIRACRMCKEEIVYTWLELIRDVIRNHWAWSGDIVDQKSLLQTEFSDILRIHLRNAIINIGNLPFWKNTETSIFDGRRNTAHWRTVFATGKTADGVLVLAEGVNLRKIIEG
ncbi:MAG: hypothetical protein FWC67_03990, partial [Defluviitaleaceae bacterium]|nr:hypothetical protein [Defluviitaleaceae bacterium]